MRRPHPSLNLVRKASLTITNVRSQLDDRCQCHCRHHSHSSISIRGLSVVRTTLSKNVQVGSQLDNPWQMSCIFCSCSCRIHQHNTTVTCFTSTHVCVWLTWALFLIPVQRTWAKSIAGLFSSLCFMVRNVTCLVLNLKLKTQKDDRRHRHTAMEEKECWLEWAYYTAASQRPEECSIFSCCTFCCIIGKCRINIKIKRRMESLVLLKWHCMIRRFGKLKSR